eukprot:scaffold1944_cov241-Pinguiococcus_pyrenoidosus.AAC.3
MGGLWPGKLVYRAVVLLMAAQMALGFGLSPGVARKDLRIRVGQYNILAANLANNLKSWFWYGYSGLKSPAGEDGAAAQPRRPAYREDGLDDVRLQVFGYGRSPLLADFWASILKKYVKIWNLFFPYELERPSHYEEGEHGLSHSDLLVLKLRDALVHFFYRDSIELAPEGEKDLAHHLFVSPAVKRTRNFELWQRIAGHVGLGLADLPAEKWDELERKRVAIDELRQRNTEDGTGDATSSVIAPDGSRWDCIADFNRTLRSFLAGFLDGEAPDEAVRQVLEEKCLRLAQLVAFSDNDMKDILRIQHESFDWQQRVQAIVGEIAKRECSAWGISELDEHEDISNALRSNPLTSRLRLVAFKHRKTLRVDDGVGIYADEGDFDVEGVGYVRYGAAAVARADERQRQQLHLRVHAGRIADGIIAPETEYKKVFHPVGGQGGLPSADEEVAKMLQQGQPVAYTYTDKLNPEQGRWFDERVATLVVLRSKVEDEADVAVRILLAATHLWHTQNNPVAEELRLIETQQMMQAMSHFKHCVEETLGSVDAEVVCGDFNDAPNFAWYEGRGDFPDPSSPDVPTTPVVEYMTQAQGFMDVLADVDGRRTPTTYTMARSYPIDYIFVRQPELRGGDAAPASLLEVKADDVQQIRLARQSRSTGTLELLPFGASEDAVTGTPMPAVGTQDTVPSDHVPVSATLRFKVAQSCADAVTTILHNRDYHS